MRKRTIKKQLWINQDEDNLLKLKSEKTGLSESEFLRSCIKGYKIKEQPTKEIRDFTKQVIGISNNINQIAIRTNIRGYVQSDELEYLRNAISKFILDFHQISLTN